MANAATTVSNEDILPLLSAQGARSSIREQAGSALTPDHLVMDLVRQVERDDTDAITQVGTNFSTANSSLHASRLGEL
jgi:hypothetical protein